MLLVSTYDLVTRIDSIYGTGLTNKMYIYLVTELRTAATIRISIEMVILTTSTCTTFIEDGHLRASGVTIKTGQVSVGGSEPHNGCQSRLKVIHGQTLIHRCLGCR